MDTDNGVVGGVWWPKLVEVALKNEFEFATTVTVDVETTADISARLAAAAAATAADTAELKPFGLRRS